MCGFSYKPNHTSESLIEILKIQKGRGLDSLGLLYNKQIYKKTPNKHKVKVSQEKIDIYSKYISNINVNGPALMHHRKASMGSVHNDNCHPCKFEGFTIMQNGTTDEFKAFAQILAPLGYEDYSDTKAIGHLFETYFHIDDKFLDNCKNLLDNWSKDYFHFGTIIITQGDDVLFWSDGLRHSKIEYDETEKFITNISNFSYNTDDNDKFQYVNIGYIKFKFKDGLIINEDIIQTVSIVKKPYYNNYNNYNSSGYSNVRGGGLDTVSVDTALDVNQVIEDNPSNDDYNDYLYDYAISFAEQKVTSSDVIFEKLMSINDGQEGLKILFESKYQKDLQESMIQTLWEEISFTGADDNIERYNEIVGMIASYDNITVDDFCDVYKSITNLELYEEFNNIYEY